MSLINNCVIEMAGSAGPVKSTVFNRVKSDIADDIYALFVEGVVITNGVKVHRIEFCLNELLVDRVLTSELVTDDLVDRRGLKFEHLRAYLKGRLSGSKSFAFKAGVNLVAFPSDATIDAYAVCGEQSEKYKIASIKVQRNRLSPPVRQDTWRPLLLTSMGRSGTTWFMHLLREHPELYIHEEYPHELLLIQYWTNMLVSLTTPLEAERQYDKWKVRDLSRHAVLPNVYYRKDVLNSDTLRYLGSSYVEELASFCVSAIDNAYRTIINHSWENGATSAPLPGVRFVSEKGLIYKNLIKELYPGSKHVFLIRDIRDNIASSKAFNAKTGRKGFGEELAKDDKDFVRLRCEQFNQRFAEYESCRQMAHFVRYEDMINTPHVMLKDVLSYLGLDNDDDVVAGMVDRASKENQDMKQHQTSSKVSSTAGRWKTDLAPELQDLCLGFSSSALKAWGYEA